MHVAGKFGDDIKIVRRQSNGANRPDFLRFFDGLRTSGKHQGGSDSKRHETHGFDAGSCNSSCICQSDHVLSFTIRAEKRRLPYGSADDCLIQN
jgi:hypothetical protein